MVQRGLHSMNKDELVAEGLASTALEKQELRAMTVPRLRLLLKSTRELHGPKRETSALPVGWKKLRKPQLIELFEAKFGRRGLLYAVMRLWERMTFACAHVSIATNESFRRIALTRGRMAPEDVFVVRSAPQVDRFEKRPPDPELRARAGTLIGYVGVIGQQEGMDLLVAAADHLLRRLGHDVHFMIVGFGPHLEAVRADVAARGLEAHFTFTGPLYGEDLLRVLNSCDIGVAPDPRNAMNDISTMNKVMEYMTLELPSVQFDLTEGRASAGEASLYAAANDPEDFAARIAWLIDNPQAGREMGRKGRARVLEGLSWAHSAPKLLAAYERVFTR